VKEIELALATGAATRAAMKARMAITIRVCLILIVFPFLLE
jgi:hypothetical protein